MNYQKVSCITMNSSENLVSFGKGLNVTVFGATGGIGKALTHNLSENKNTERVFAISRSPNKQNNHKVTSLQADIENENDIKRVADYLRSNVGELHMVLVATGVLHVRDKIKPEKSWRAIDANSLETIFRINAFGPALIAKHFLPLLARKRKSIFAALSARVGSIEDNHLGGWYAYRGSKAALNMLIRTLSIELNRLNPHAICVGLHPGTVNTSLSKPYQGSVPKKDLFSAQHSAGYLLNVVNNLQKEHSGRIFAWDGKPIPF